MCGICGIVYRDRTRPVDQEMLQRMTATLTHRGPDDEGQFRAPGVGLGVRRLSIIDLEGGHQPITNETGDVVLVCNGEIYNYRELRNELEQRGHRFSTRSDAETIVHLYEESGPACAERLRGMFAFAVWDGPRGRLLLVRDRLGIKTLDWVAGDWGVAFGSEAKAILAGGQVRAELRPEAVDDSLALGHVLGPGTAFAGIHRLQPGHLAVVEEGAASVRRYWSHPIPGEGRRRGARRRDLAGELRERLEDSVRLHLRADVPVGAYLSGGIDSSAVVALMERNGVERPAVYTIAFTDDPRDEAGRVRMLDQFPGHAMERRIVRSDRDDLLLLPMGIWHSEDPCSISLGVPHLRLAKGASESFKAVLSGEGSDESNYGYWWYGLEPWAHWLSYLPAPWRHRGMRRSRRRSGAWPWIVQDFLAPPGPGLERFGTIAGPPGSDDRARILDPALAQSMAPAPERWPDPPAALASLHPVERLQYWDSTTRLPDYILQRVDRLAMAYGVEVRIPFLDHELFEWTVRTIPWWANSYPREKATLRRAMKGILPRPIQQRRKRPLHAPYELWLRGALPAYAEELLSERSLRDKGIFDPAAVRSLLDRHRAGVEERGLQLLAILSYQVWDEIFLRGTTPSALAGTG